MTVVRSLIDPATGLALFVAPSDPSAGSGLDAPLGSLANIAGSGTWYAKTAAAVTGWSQLALSSGFLPLAGGSLNAGANLIVPGTLTAGAMALAAGGALVSAGGTAAAPAFTTRSAGTRFVIFPNISGTTLDYAIGVESSNVWLSSGGGIKFYTNGLTASMTLAGTTLTVASLVGNVTGNLTGTVLTPAQGSITSLGTLTGLTVGGAFTTTQQAVSGSAVAGFGGGWVSKDDGGTSRWAAGILGAVGGRDYQVFDIVNNRSPLVISATSGMTFIGVGLTVTSGITSSGLIAANGGVQLAAGQYVATLTGGGNSGMKGDGSGGLVLHANTADRVTMYSDQFRPNTDNAMDLGLAGNRWRNLYAVSASFSTVAGTLSTAAQPNVTSLGTLTGLVSSGALQSGQFGAGSGQTAPGWRLEYSGVSPVISRIVFGTDNSGWQFAIASANGATVTNRLTVSDAGSVTAGAFTGTTFTASGSIAANGGITVAAGQAIFVPGNGGGAILARNAANTAYLDLLYQDASDRPTIPRQLVATLFTAAQPNITSVGTLTSLTVSGVSALAGRVDMGSYLNLNRNGVVASGIQFYSTSMTAYQLYMGLAGTASQGVLGNVTPPSGSHVTTWALRSLVGSVSAYGWTWEAGAETGSYTPTLVMELTSASWGSPGVPMLKLWGDMTVRRSSTSGVIYFGDQAAWLYFVSGAFDFSGKPLGNIGALTMTGTLNVTGAGSFSGAVQAASYTDGLGNALPSIIVAGVAPSTQTANDGTLWIVV